ncbi:hypothetical protein GUITHDRAFT_137502 [Guillardia theta CCMP2712]|uniref:Homeobox domain-containing protein n=1 Tax=Guillardia theta (strain CCMP2712) TaxID=905079 RepID=L1JFM9_GUITC|nr:hypothetical protein GUITHDRAFT_137502 [Guillardia theta CCMP2712]EKX47318.1 hypothetical protein GUITHDRAFT_137502 [Guillardia theta CCMP2712]|eukprot:XP_005834298.1 hypothetical protein GUITHDRAFT_137502 [Guillardia theta CCMP2712]
MSDGEAELMARDAVEADAEMLPSVGMMESDNYREAPLSSSSSSSSLLSQSLEELEDEFNRHELLRIPGLVGSLINLVKKTSESESSLTLQLNTQDVSEPVMQQIKLIENQFNSEKCKVDQVCEDVCQRMRTILNSQRKTRHVSEQEENVHCQAIQAKFQYQEYVNDCLNQLNLNPDGSVSQVPSASPHKLIKLSAGSAGESGNDSQPRRKRENLPKRAIEKLLEWLNQHWGHPYPSEQEKQTLADATGLNVMQVSNWPEIQKQAEAVVSKQQSASAGMGYALQIQKGLRGSVQFPSATDAPGETSNASSEDGGQVASRSGEAEKPARDGGEEVKAGAEAEEKKAEVKEASSKEADAAGKQEQGASDRKKESKSEQKHKSDEQGRGKAKTQEEAQEDDQSGKKAEESGPAQNGKEEAGKSKTRSKSASKQAEPAASPVVKLRPRRSVMSQAPSAVTHGWTCRRLRATRRRRRRRRRSLQPPRRLRGCGNANADEEEAKVEQKGQGKGTGARKGKTRRS